MQAWIPLLLHKWIHRRERWIRYKQQKRMLDLRHFIVAADGTDENAEKINQVWHYLDLHSIDYICRMLFNRLCYLASKGWWMPLVHILYIVDSVPSLSKKFHPLVKETLLHEAIMNTPDEVSLPSYECTWLHEFIPNMSKELVRKLASSPYNLVEIVQENNLRGMDFAQEAEQAGDLERLMLISEALGKPEVSKNAMQRCMAAAKKNEDYRTVAECALTLKDVHAARECLSKDLHQETLNELTLMLARLDQIQKIPTEQGS